MGSTDTSGEDGGFRDARAQGAIAGGHQSPCLPAAHLSRSPNSSAPCCASSSPVTSCSCPEATCRGQPPGARNLDGGRPSRAPVSPGGGCYGRLGLAASDCRLGLDQLRPDCVDSLLEVEHRAYIPGDLPEQRVVRHQVQDLAVGADVRDAEAAPSRNPNTQSNVPSSTFRSSQ